MNKQRIITFMVSVVSTVAALVALAAMFELTRVPALHYEIGWLVTMLGCSLMAWRLHSKALLTLALCAAFLLVVRFTAFTLVYALLESAILWKLT
jgi:hypothetical protein